MKIVVSQNRSGVDDIRKAITKSADLAKFDQFIAKYPTIDLNDPQQQSDAKCCGGENCCQNISVPISVSAL